MLVCFVSSVVVAVSPSNFLSIDRLFVQFFRSFIFVNIAESGPSYEIPISNRFISFLLVSSRLPPLTAQQPTCQRVFVFFSFFFYFIILFAIPSAKSIKNLIL